MDSNLYWEKFVKTGKVADYLSYRHPDVATIKHHTRKGAAYFPHLPDAEE